MQQLLARARRDADAVRDALLIASLFPGSATRSPRSPGSLLATRSSAQYLDERWVTNWVTIALHDPG